MDSFILEMKERLGFLFNQEDFAIVSESAQNDQPNVNCQLILSNGELDIKTTKDRGQFFIDIKASQMKLSEWTSIGLIRHILLGAQGFDEMLDGKSVDFLKRYYNEIKDFFLVGNLEEVRNTIKKAKTERSKFLFG
tara:strand:- start:3218 stop:3625 length:408 start_codon:yes stop_codon:yes gene_type:complete